MARVTGPLHSMEAGGQFGGTMIFDLRGYVRKMFKPANPRSAGQTTIRTKFRAGTHSVDSIGSNSRDLLRAITPIAYYWDSNLYRLFYTAHMEHAEAFTDQSQEEQDQWTAAAASIGIQDWPAVHAQGETYQEHLALWCLAWAFYDADIYTELGQPGSIGLNSAEPLTLVLDDFNRADKEPPPSASWTTMVQGHKVVSNRCKGNSAAFYNVSRWSAQQFPKNCEAYLTIAARPNNTGYVALVARYGLDNLNGYMVTAQRNDSTGDTVTISRIDDDTPGDPLFSVAQTITNNDKLLIRCRGNTISAHYQPTGGSWGILGSIEDSTHNQPGYVLLFTRSNVPEIDDFGGGELPLSNAAYWAAAIAS